MDAVVEAEVAGVKDDEPFRLPPTKDGYSPDPWPAVAVHFRLIRHVRGDAVAREFKVRTIGSTDPTRPVTVENAPPYATGERYVLFLRRNPRSNEYHVLEVDGRYRREASGRFRSVGDDLAADRLNGRSTSQIEEALR